MPHCGAQVEAVQVALISFGMYVNRIRGHGWMSHETEMFHIVAGAY